MSAHNTPSPFPRGVTWLGVLILSSALATMGQSPAQAATGALATSSMQWTNLTNEGVLSGGVPVDFSSGVGGWGSNAFDSAGVMGIEWTTVADPTRRTVYVAPNATPTPQSGGESGITSFSYLTPKPAQVIATTATTKVAGDQAQWTIRLESTAPDAMTGNRFFWMADLPDGYNSVFSTPQSDTVLVKDQTGAHPTMVLRATTTAGTLGWGGDSRFTDPLVNGETTPTLYVHSTSEIDITITVTVGIIDHDPCSGDAALALASQSAGVYGTSFETLNSCLLTPDWNPVQAGSEPSTVTLDLDSRVGALEPHQTRIVTISGLPENVSWSQGASTPVQLPLELSADRTVTPGEYPLEFEVVTRSDIDSTVSFSEPLRTSGVLTILPAAPLPEPEPEPQPEPELEQEPELETPPAEETAAEDEILVATVESPAGGESSSSPSSGGTKPPILEADPVLNEAPNENQEAPLQIPQSTYVPSTPPERELFTPELRREPITSEIPPPSSASSWLGLSLAIAVAVSGIFALLRRRRRQEQE